MWLVAAAPKELGQYKNNKLRPVLFSSASSSGGEGDVDAKGVFLLPARVANIWRFSPNIARQLL